jgi:hypothetical protein
MSDEKNTENATVSKIDYSAVAEKPAVAFKSLKRLVGDERI